jgi:TRAP-type mannitol/chloroaromatic compound transport system substrate-binding protein
LDAIQQKGITITTLPTNVLRKLRAATLTVLNAAAASNPDFAAVWESQRDFVNRNRLWFNDGPIDRDFRFVDWPGWESDF